MAKQKQLVITSRYHKILQAVHLYRYVRVLDITRLFFAPTSINYAGAILKQLTDADYLYRFPLPHTRIGSVEYIYTLGAKGRTYLQELGMEIDWYFRPHKVSSLTYQHMQHAIALTKFLIAAEVFARKGENISLIAVRTEYELAKQPSFVNLSGIGHVKVIPDAWLKFDLLKQGQHQAWLPVLLEIDRGTEIHQRFLEHVNARIEFVKPQGGYKQVFGTSAVTIAYATTSGEQRLADMLDWTEDLLQKRHLEHYNQLFKFCALPSGELEENWLFHSSSWYRPLENQPITLL